MAVSETAGKIWPLRSAQSKMRHHPSRRAALAVLAFLATGIAFADDTKGSFGFVGKVDSDATKVAGAKASAMADRMKKKPRTALINDEYEYGLTEGEVPLRG